jgi:hypothetical protein
MEPDVSETPHSEHKFNRHPAHHRRPPSWPEYRSTVRHAWAAPFFFLDWVSQWCVYAMSHLSFFDLLEYCGSFSILVAVIFYFVDAPQRTKVKHYQAWQVINSAQGKGGSGGRIEALQELNEDHVSLLGVDLSDAFLQGVKLSKADLERANLASADMRSADLSKTKLQSASLRWTNLINATLAGADVADAHLEDADLTDADLQELKNWQQIASIKDATIARVRNAPAGFVAWALRQGATVKDDSDRPATTRSAE